MPGGGDIGLPLTVGGLDGPGDEVAPVGEVFLVATPVPDKCSICCNAMNAIITF